MKLADIAVNATSVSYDGNFYTTDARSALSALFQVLSTDDWKPLISGVTKDLESGSFSWIIFEDNSCITLLDPREYNAVVFFTSEGRDEWAAQIEQLIIEQNSVGKLARDLLDYAREKVKAAGYTEDKL